jgi:hypothetical protein
LAGEVTAYHGLSYGVIGDQGMEPGGGGAGAS